MKTIVGDLLAMSEGIITHQCNCLGVMGAGVALKIKQKWPQVFEAYRKAFLEKRLRLGEINIVPITPDLYVVNLLGQDRYGRDHKHTDYNAVAEAFGRLHKLAEGLSYVTNRHWKVYIPYLMGCANAGGNWEVYSKIVDIYCPGTIAVKYNYTG